MFLEAAALEGWMAQVEVANELLADQIIVIKCSNSGSGRVLSKSLLRSPRAVPRHRQDAESFMPVVIKTLMRKTSPST